MTNFDCRVLEIMKRDAKRDPADFPDAMRAKVLINQVLEELILYSNCHYSYMNISDNLIAWWLAACHVTEI